jgi:hypothetical protein
MKDLRKNEFKDLLEMNELIFEEKDYSIIADLPKLGSVTYYPKSNKIQVHKTNIWIENGYIYVKNLLKL